MDEYENGFVVFPTPGYWEIDGKPVSPVDAQYGLHPRAKWCPTEVTAAELEDNEQEHAEEYFHVGTFVTPVPGGLKITISWKEIATEIKLFIVKKIAQVLYRLRLLKGYQLNDENKYHFIWFWKW